METVKKPPGEEMEKAAKPANFWKNHFWRKRAGVRLTHKEVKQIKAGRKKLRKELRAAGIRDRKSFELTASSMMLYFDKPKFITWLLWLFGGRGLWMLLGALALLLLALFAMSVVTQLRGHFTITLSGDMFREGFTLSEKADFSAPTIRLFTEPAVDVPAISIEEIDPNVLNVDGQYENGKYFAYTFYLRNEGESTVSYTWKLQFNSESHDLSKALWAMVFEDDAMRFYAQPRLDGTQEALPYFDDDTRGYLHKPLSAFALQEDEQYKIVRRAEDKTYYRVVPFAFESEDVITSGIRQEVAPMDVHKYTVVLWLEGDDPDCTNALIGGHAGVQMQFQLEEEEAAQTDSFSSQWDQFWNNIWS